MNKQALVSELAQKLGISQKACRKAMDLFFEEIILVLEEGGQYSQTGFGTFRTTVSSKRISFNPVIKKRMLLPEKRKMKFKPSARLKEEINE